MNFVTNFAKFWYDFIIGDDWTIAAAVVVALIVLKLLTLAHLNAWWLLPLVVIVFLYVSLMRAVTKK